MTRTNGCALVLALVAGCGRAEGTEPHDMSTSGHEQAAASEEAAAGEHAAEYDPVALRAQRNCLSLRAASDATGGACWSADVNPTEEHRAAAAQHRELAEQHRAAAQALRDAEASACVGIDELDRDMSPFDNRADIASVARLTETVQTGRQTREQLVGATVVFRARPGMTAEWLQRVVDCHLARNAALGHDVPEMPYCPLVPRGATARVRSTGDGFAIDVRGDSPETAEEIARRAEGLTTPAP